MLSRGAYHVIDGIDDYPRRSRAVRELEGRIVRALIAVLASNMTCTRRLEIVQRLIIISRQQYRTLLRKAVDQRDLEHVEVLELIDNDLVVPWNARSLLLIHRDKIKDDVGVPTPFTVVALALLVEGKVRIPIIAVREHLLELHAAAKEYLGILLNDTWQLRKDGYGLAVGSTLFTSGKAVQR